MQNKELFVWILEFFFKNPRLHKFMKGLDSVMEKVHLKSLEFVKSFCVDFFTQRVQDLAAMQNQVVFVSTQFFVDEFVHRWQNLEPLV